MPQTNSASAALTGFTDELVISYQDFFPAVIGTVAANAAVTKTYAVPAGSFVDIVALRLDEAWGDPFSIGTLGVVVGDGASANGYVLSSELHGSQSFITSVQCNTGAFVSGGSGARGKTYATADTIDVTFTPASFSLNDSTAGKVTIKFRIARF